MGAKGRRVRQFRLTQREKHVLEALPVYVDLDVAQVSGRAGMKPAEVKTVLAKLTAAHKVELADSLPTSSRPRYRRLA